MTKKQAGNLAVDTLRAKEKRKWQIALRRYVFEEGFSTGYAPYFGLDRVNLRKWLEIQFTAGQSWESFALNWQIGQLIPAHYFNLEAEEELRLCWNFLNLRVEPVQVEKAGQRTDLLFAKIFFSKLYAETQSPSCKKLLQRIEGIEQANPILAEKQSTFLKEHSDYLGMIQNYSSFEFELLNRGRSVEDVNREAEALKKIKI
jgi:hypothetical protein